jgi:hypothetical protein
VGEGGEDRGDREPAEGAAEERVGEVGGEGEVAEGAGGEGAEEDGFEGGGAAAGEAAAPELRGDAGAGKDEALPEEDSESDEQRPVGHGAGMDERAAAEATEGTEATETTETEKEAEFFDRGLRG